MKHDFFPRLCVWFENPFAAHVWSRTLKDLYFIHSCSGYLLISSVLECSKVLWWYAKKFSMSLNNDMYNINNSTKQKHRKVQTIGLNDPTCKKTDTHRPRWRKKEAKCNTKKEDKPWKRDTVAEGQYRIAWRSSHVSKKTNSIRGEAVAW